MMREKGVEDHLELFHASSTSLAINVEAKVDQKGGGGGD